MQVYGTVRFQCLGHASTAVLTDGGWIVQGRPEIAEGLNAIANPSDYSAGDGDPIAAALADGASVVGGEYTIEGGLESAPEGAIY